MGPSWAGAAVFMAVAMLVAGCSSGADKKSGAELWKGEFAAAVEDATTDWEREILERAAKTGTITDEDFAFAEQAMLQCMTDRGVPGTKETDPNTGYYSYSWEPSPELDFETIQKECSVGNGMVVRSLYNDQQGNPDYEDVNKLMAKCLASEGLVDKSYSADDYARDNELDSPPFDQSSDGFLRCYMNPTGKK